MTLFAEQRTESSFDLALRLAIERNRIDDLKRLLTLVGGRDALTRAAATLGIQGGRKWAEFTAAEVEALHVRAYLCFIEDDSKRTRAATPPVPTSDDQAREIDARCDELML